MTPEQTLAHLRSRATQPLSPEELRELSNLAWYAIGGSINLEDGFEFYIPPGWPNTNQAVLTEPPNPTASIDDAVRWMVPEGADVDLSWNEKAASADLVLAEKDKRSNADVPQPNPALALTIAGLSAALEKE